MKRLFFVLIFLFAFSVLGANGQPRENFPYVSVPYYIVSDGVADAEWVALHFWDRYDFASCDSRYEPMANREGFMTFVNTLYATSPKCSFTAVEAMMTKAAVSEDAYWHFLELAEVVLYDPSSPLRNDLLWEPFVRHAVGERSPLDDDSKSRYRTLLTLVSRNQQGTIATDFVYTLANGKQGRLHDIKAPFTLLWFYNAGCSECARTKAEIEATGYLDMLHSVGALAVLALYPDTELDKWRKALPENPSWWISAYDKGQVILRQNLYDLKATPTIYLLDAEKRVIMKDPTVEDLLGVLDSICYGG